MNNKQINKIKRRADTLADFFIEKYERLEQAKHELVELNNRNHLKLREYEIAFEKALGEITEVKKRQNGMIEIYLKDSAGGEDILYAYFDQGEPIYPLAEMLFKKYVEKKEFDHLIKKIENWTKPVGEFNVEPSSIIISKKETK